MECSSVRRGGVKPALVCENEQSLRACYSKYRQILETYKAHQKDGRDTRQQRVNEKNGRWKRRDFNSPAADCRKRADTQSNADSGIPADIPADSDFDPTLHSPHSPVAKPAPI